MDRGVWQATVHGVIKSPTQLNDNNSSRVRRESVIGLLFSCCSEGENSEKLCTRKGRGTNHCLLQPHCSSVTKSCPTLGNPVDCSTPGFSVLHYLLEFAQTHVLWVSDATQPSYPLSSPSLLALNLSQHPSLFQWVGSLHQVARILELQHQSFQWMFRVDFL